MTDPNQSVVDPAANAGVALAEAPVSQNPGLTGDEAQKVFAGNLAFATTEEELKNVFSEAGTVTQAQIITRGTRSLGYGFVTFSSEAEAQKAVQLLDKKEIGGREISVESAKPQVPGEAKKAPKPKKQAEKKPRSSGARAARRPRTDEGEEGGADTAGEESAKEGDKANGTGKSKSARRRQKKAAAEEATKSNGEAAEANGASGEAKPKAPKPKRQPKGAPTGTPSKTLVFVANLAFETTDESLKAAFSKDFKVAMAHVVKRKEGNRSKGFGFVDFAEEAEQKKAIDTAQGREIDGRAVSLKVAVEEDKDAKVKTDEDAAPAAAAAA